MKTKLAGIIMSRITVVVLILMFAGSQIPVYAHRLHDSRTDFIAYVVSSAQSEMRDSGVPASFSIGQSAHETGFNRFPPYSNFHGIKCPGPPSPARCENNWRAYNTPEEAFLDHGHWLTQNTRYANAFNYVDDPAQFAREVANAGYSEGDRAYYANVVIGYINQYNLTQYDNQNTPFVGIFYTNRDLNGQPVWVNQAQELNFDWGGGSPNWRIGADNFSVRWKAKRQFSAGRYRFHTVIDDGVRLWVDGNLVIDQWHDQAPTEWTGDIPLGDGFHWIRMEYYERGGGAVARLWWERIDGGPGTCPPISDWKGEYWNNQSLSGSPVLCRNDRTVDFDWGSGGPGGGMPNDRLSARWTRNWNFAAGRYRFHLRGDDGIRLWVDGNLIIDQWHDQGRTEYTADRDLSGGDHSLRVEYYENGGDANIALWWDLRPSNTCPGQYRAEYYSNHFLNGSPTFTQCEGWPINHDWGGSGPGNGVGSDNFAARWTGRAYIAAGTYTFIARADDGIRVWIDGNLIIDQWHDQAPTEYRVTRSISSGDHDIKVEYYENGGGAVAQFKWEQQGACSSNPIFIEQNVRGTISTSQQRDTYCLSANTGQWISIRMVGNPYLQDYRRDTVLEVYDPGGTRIGYNDDGAFVSDPNSFYYYNSFLAVYLPSAGTYQIIARFWGSDTGPYAIRVEGGHEAAPGDLNRDCIVNSLDASIMVSRINSNDPNADLTLKGMVNSLDYILLGANMGRQCGAATGPCEVELLQKSDVEEPMKQIESQPTPIGAELQPTPFPPASASN